MAVERKFYRIAEVAAMLGLTRQRVWELIQMGAIPGVKVSSMRWMVPAAALEDLERRAFARLRAGDDAKAP